MSRIILTTSSSSLDDYDIDTDVQLIRLHVYIENVEFIGGKNISRNRLIHMMNQVGESTIKTSPATHEEVSQIFERLYSRGIKEVLVITLSSELSQSYDIIEEVAERFKRKMKIMLIDSFEINACEAILALEAEYLSKQGMSLVDIASRLNQYKDAHKTYFALDDIGQLIRNKKISATAGFFANLLNIKPVLHVDYEGKIVPLTRVRSFSKAATFLVDEIKDIINIHEDYIYVLSTGNDEITKNFVELLQKSLGIQRIPVLPASLVSIANHGAGAIGVCMFRKHVPTVLTTLTL